MYTISQLAKQMNLSRSSLIYYDKVGLLQPSCRSSSNYRLYSEQDKVKLEQINQFRAAGLSLEAIKQLLQQNNSSAGLFLEQRLEQINHEIRQLRSQQQQIVNLLGQTTLLPSTRLVNKAQWVEMLEASGMDEADMRQWHIEFERKLPEAHTDFLQSLGIPEQEIERIKSWAE